MFEDHVGLKVESMMKKNILRVSIKIIDLKR
jgi:hypothetical protein